ncbi:oligodendrocyte-myelin glycoprotein [Cyprinodon tularosa]|uniref:oligodendrocyte-myelin glycoprotein n=1 Tax=Cyprinodon tularosa TaxID=77115 RepID=UPI0018E25B35|nr:oligodendrocyte-myelin glycoprotein [Cyprinodon tularosa]
MTRALTMLASFFLLLLCGLLGGCVLSVCPSVCSCSGGHRDADCSSRGLTKLPRGLQHNIRFLNLSFNSLQVLGGELGHYAQLRTLDLSFNHLESLPPVLPRSLWDIKASWNHLRSLDKNDTAFHWNLKQLDLSHNELERIVFINNTLLSVKSLNLSHNRFWTVPTNMPQNLESIDLSFNYLVQILPGSLDRLPRLLKLYLHANHFSSLTGGVFDKLTALETITLGDNPWACEEENITGILQWAEKTGATVLGCPCFTRPVCGQNHLATRDGEPEPAPLTEETLWVNNRGEGYDDVSTSRTIMVTSTYEENPSLYQTGLLVWTSSTKSHSVSEDTSTVKPKMASSVSSAQTVEPQMKIVTLNFLLCTIATSM